MSKPNYLRPVLYLVPMLLLLLVGVALAGSGAESTWQIQTIETGLGAYGGYSSLALDTAGHPHVAYRDGVHGTLKYAYHDGTSWHLSTVGSANTWGISLALDAADRPHVAFRYSGSLKYAYFDGAAWQISTVDSAGDTGWDASLALDGAGLPRIAYIEHNALDLKYAAYDGSSWQITTVDSVGDVGRWASLELDAAGRPHIAYLDYTHDDLKHAYFDGTAWHIEQVDTVGSVGFDISLALDSAGLPHVSYGDRSSGLAALKYGYFDGSSWHLSVVDATGDIRFTSLGLDGAGRPRISYMDWTSASVKYAAYDGQAWQIETVDGMQPVSYYTALALDGAGNPHISYHDSANGALKYAVGSNPPPPPTATPVPPTATPVPPTPTPMPSPDCNLYPIALHIDTVRDALPGEEIRDILNGTGRGNFGWLTWTGNQGEPVLVRSLTPPGDSYTYINPNNPNDHVVSLGDQVYGRPGVADSKKVRTALDALKPLVITVPVWGAVEAGGLSVRYQVVGFARVQIIDYALPRQNRISVIFWGFASCGDDVAKARR
jgi:hypothetical protein